MSSVGACLDNAVVERFFGSLKHEWLLKVVHLTRESMKLDVEEYINTLASDKITVVYVDNASMHRSARFREQCDDWFLKKWVVVYLPPYSPELNIIEILWKKIKYEWISCHAYETFEKLTDSVETS